MEETIKFKLNNKPITFTVNGERMLLWVLRIDLDLSRVRYGCGEGLCDACNVLVNNKAVRSCPLLYRSNIIFLILTKGPASI
ncbi:MAG: 2Fe-2S iron-sulfur cluster binding domain-containing protein, partial [bacterium]